MGRKDYNKDWGELDNVQPSNDEKEKSVSDNVVAQQQKPIEETRTEELLEKMQLLEDRWKSFNVEVQRQLVCFQNSVTELNGLCRKFEEKSKTLEELNNSNLKTLSNLNYNISTESTDAITLGFKKALLGFVNDMKNTFDEQKKNMQEYFKNEKESMQKMVDERNKSLEATAKAEKDSLDKLIKDKQKETGHVFISNMQLYHVLAILILSVGWGVWGMGNVGLTSDDARFCAGLFAGAICFDILFNIGKWLWNYFWGRKTRY